MTFFEHFSPFPGCVCPHWRRTVVSSPSWDKWFHFGCYSSYIWLLVPKQGKNSTIFHFQIKCWKGILLVSPLCGKEGPQSIAVSVTCIEPGQWIVNVRIKSAELTIDVYCGVSSILLIGLAGVRVSRRYYCAPSSATEQLSSKRANQSDDVLSLISLKLVCIVRGTSIILRKTHWSSLRYKPVLFFVAIVAVYFRNCITPINALFEQNSGCFSVTASCAYSKQRTLKRTHFFEFDYM
jgi:hypothetical protein